MFTMLRHKHKYSRQAYAVENEKSGKLMAVTLTSRVFRADTCYLFMNLRSRQSLININNKLMRTMKLR